MKNSKVSLAEIPTTLVTKTWIHLSIQPVSLVAICLYLSTIFTSLRKLSLLVISSLYTIYSSVNFPSKHFQFIIFMSHTFNNVPGVVQRYGLLRLKRAFVSGNYHKATGIGYGGTKRAASTEMLISLVRELGIPENAERVGGNFSV